MLSYVASFSAHYFVILHRNSLLTYLHQHIMSKEVSSEANKKRKRNDVEGTSTDTNEEETTHHLSLFDLSPEIVGNVSNYLSMPDINNFTLVIGW